MWRTNEEFINEFIHRLSNIIDDEFTCPDCGRTYSTTSGIDFSQEIRLIIKNMKADCDLYRETCNDFDTEFIKINFDLLD